MDNWDPVIIYQMVAEQHRERVARGEAAQRLAAALGARSVRTRLATALVALAHHFDFDPARRAGGRVDKGLAPPISA